MQSLFRMRLPSVTMAAELFNYSQPWPAQELLLVPCQQSTHLPFKLDGCGCSYMCFIWYSQLFQKFSHTKWLITSIRAVSNSSERTENHYFLIFAHNLMKNKFSSILRHSLSLESFISNQPRIVQKLS
jgi:hypothetical protein